MDTLKQQGEQVDGLTRFQEAIIVVYMPIRSVVVELVEAQMEEMVHGKVMLMKEILDIYNHQEKVGH